MSPCSSHPTMHNLLPVPSLITSTSPNCPHGTESKRYLFGKPRKKKKTTQRSPEQVPQQLSHEDLAQPRVALEEPSHGVVMHHGHLHEMLPWGGWAHGLMLTVPFGSWWTGSFEGNQGGWWRAEGQGQLTPTAPRPTLFSGGNCGGKIRSRLNFIYSLN